MQEIEVPCHGKDCPCVNPVKSAFIRGGYHECVNCWHVYHDKPRTGKKFKK